MRPILALMTMAVCLLGLALPAHGYYDKKPGSYSPATAYDPSSNRFLMVYTDIDEFSVPSVYGIFVRPDASPEGPPFRISGNKAVISYDTRPAIAVDPQKGVFLVAWHDWRSGNPDIYASILNSSGIAELPETAITEGAAAEQFPVAAFSPEAESFILAWEDARNGDMDIFTRSVKFNDNDAPAIIKGPVAPAYRAQGDQTWPSIAYYNSPDYGAYYLLAFEDLSPKASLPTISGQIINASTGKALMPLKLGLDISGKLGGYAPSVTATGSDDIPFMVAWQGGQGELLARYMDTGGFSHPPFDRVFTPEGVLGTAGRVKVSADPSTGRSALFWQESAGKLHDIYASFIEPGETSGSVYHVMQVAGEEDRDEINLDVSYNSTWPSFLVAYESTDYLTSFNILLTSVSDPDYPEIAIEDPVYPFEDLSVAYPGVLFNTAVSHTLSVYNDSPYAGLRIMNINTTGPFTVASENCTLETLAPSGGPCSVTVEFSPGTRGPQSGSVSIMSDDPNEPSALLHLSGNSLAPSMEITDTSMPPDDLVLHFGDIRPGEMTEGTITVTNRGDHLLSLGIVRDTASPGFGVKADNCSLQALPPSAYCTVVLYASPSYEGPMSGGVWIISDDPENGDVLVKLRAEGSEPSIEATGTDGPGFGWVQSGQSAKREFSIRNNGGTSLNIHSIETEGKAFSIEAGGCNGATLAPGEACSISVSFSPDDTFSHSGSIIINSDSGVSAAAELAGFGAAPIASVHVEGTGGRSMEFEGIQQGRALSRSVRITNIGNATLMPAYSSLSGEGFSLASDQCSGKSLPYAASCDILVRFSPTDDSQYTGGLIIRTNDPEEGEIEVSLSGTGI